MTSILRERLESATDEDDTLADKIVDMLIRLALDREALGDRQAIKDIFDRVDGKVSDKLEVTETRKEYDVTNTPDDL